MTTVTAITVVSDNEEVLLRFGETTLRNTPSEFPKIIVDNTPYPAPRVQEILSFWTHEYENVLLLFNRKDLSAYPTHGDALDLAVRYVGTPFLVTFDFDFFLTDPKFWKDVLQKQQETGAAVVGEAGPYSIYTFPFCCLYSKETARRFGFFKRERPAEWKKYISISTDDPWWMCRERECDVGESLYLQALEDGCPVVNDFPVEQFGTHLWAAAPFGMVDYDANYYTPTRWKGA